MVHVFSEHLSPVEESAGNKKTEGRNDLANYRAKRLDSILNVLVEPFKLCILGSQLFVFGFLSLSQKKFAQNCQKPFHMPLLRAKVEIWGPRFQKHFRKKPKPKWMIKPMTKSLPMIRMSQASPSVGPSINLSLA